MQNLEKVRSSNKNSIFVADGMLGKISRWLRLLGFNTEYFKDLDDHKLVIFARENNRIILSRDKQLIQKAKNLGAKIYYVKGNTIIEQLADFASHFKVKLEINHEKILCTKCNTILTPVQKKQIQKILIRTMMVCGMVGKRNML